MSDGDGGYTTELTISATSVTATSEELGINEASVSKRIKPLHEVYFVPGVWSPTTCWNECLVDVRRVQA